MTAALRRHLRSSARLLAPGWLRTVVRPSSGPIPVERAVRAVIAVTIPSAVGAALGALSVTTLISIGAMVGTAVDRDVPYRLRVLRVGGAVLAGSTGWMLGRTTQHFGGTVWVVVVVTVVAVVSAVISGAGGGVSLAGLQLLIMTTVSSGRPFPGPVWEPGLLFLGGGVWALSLSLLFGLGRRTVHERRATAGVYSALADQLDAAGDDRETAETRRQAVTEALSNAYDALLTARLGHGGRDRAFQRLFALLNAATLVGEAVTAMLRDGARPPESVAPSLREIATAVEHGRDPPAPPTTTVPAPGPATEGRLWRALEALDGVLGGQELTLGDRWAPPSWTERLHRIRDVLTPGPAGWRAAARLSLCMAGAEVVSHIDSAERSYWVALTVAVVLKPDLGSVLARGVQRGLGTIVGVVLGSVVIEFVPAGPWMLPFIALFAAIIPIGQTRNYGMFATFLTPLILVLIDMFSRLGSPLLRDRALDSVIGVAIVLVLGYVIWPESWHARLGERVAVTVEGLRTYLDESVDAEPGARAVARRGAYRRLADLRTAFQQTMSEPGAVARRAAAWWPVVIGLERTTDAITRSAVIGSEARRDQLDEIRAAVDDLAATVRDQRSPADVPLPDDGEFAEVATELRAVRATLGGPDADHGEDGTDGGLAGRVVDEDGGPVAGARVTVTDLDGHQIDQVSVDDDGAYRIHSTGPGDPRLVVAGAPGHRPVAVWRGGAVPGDGTLVLARRIEQVSRGRRVG